jgi:putative DNA primase/helicase
MSGADLRVINGEGGEPAIESVSDSCTDKANARAFAAVNADRFRYQANRKTWRKWDGRRWADATEVDLMRAAKEVADLLLERAARIKNPDVREAMVKHALKTCGRARLEAMIALSASEPQFDATTDIFDTKPYLLTVKNGTINLRTGEIKPHDREDYITKLTDIEYDPSAGATGWEQFQREIFDGDQELMAYVQRACGYSLTGETREQCFFLLHGSGCNGKGRHVRQLARLAGDAACVTPFSALTADRAKQSGNTPELAKLAGARVVTAGEPDRGVKLSESIIKTLTGEDPITVCAKYEAPFTFVPAFKLWLHANHKPRILGTDPGIWRRPRFIPFLISFEGRKDETLDVKLDAEASGILAWAVRGAIEWYAHGLGGCAKVEAHTKAYREEEDTLGKFIADALETAPDGFVASKELHAAYKAWCEQASDEPVGNRLLGRMLAERGFCPGKKSGVRGFSGWALKVTES